MRATGDATLASVIDELDRAGFGEHFGVSDGTLRSFDSGRAFRASQVVIHAFRRFEGVSDPDDMSIVYAIEGQGGARGTLVDAFGAYSDPAVTAFLEGVTIGGVGPTAHELPRFGRYAYGFSVPVPSDPSRDEGGESGSVA